MDTPYVNLQEGGDWVEMYQCTHPDPSSSTRCEGGKSSPDLFSESCVRGWTHAELSISLHLT